MKVQPLHLPDFSPMPQREHNNFYNNYVDILYNNYLENYVRKYVAPYIFQELRVLEEAIKPSGILAEIAELRASD